MIHPFIQEHGTLFPPRGDGTAHPHDSLASPERLSPDAYRSYDSQLGADPKLLLRVAERAIEHALATPGTEGDAYDFAQAEAALATSQASGLGITNPVVMNRRIFQEYMPVLKARAAHLWPPPECYRVAQEGIGDLISLFLVTSGECTPKEYCGRLSELITHYGLLCGGRVIMPVTKRQEANRYVHDNHDLDVFRPFAAAEQDDPALVKGIVVPVSVKHIGPKEENPLVATVRVGLIAKAAWRESAKQYASHPNSPERTVDFTTALAETMVAHAGGRTLSAFELDFLARSITGFCDVIDTFVPARPEPLPRLAPSEGISLAYSQ